MSLKPIWMKLAMLEANLIKIFEYMTITFFVFFLETIKTFKE